MIKANKGTVELNGKAYQLLGELEMIVSGIYYIMTEKQAQAPKDARRMIGKAVKMGLDLENDAVMDVEKVKAEKPGKKANDGLNTLLERIMDFLEDEEADDADDFD